MPLWYSHGMPFSSAATRHLDAHALPYSIFQHKQPPASLEQAALDRGQQPGQVIRSILFRHSENVFVLVLMAGPAQLSWKRIRSHLGVTRLSMATEAEVLAITGCELGTVNPLGLPQPLRILADESVFKPEEISIGSGVRGTAIILKPGRLLKALPGIEIGRFA